MKTKLGALVATIVALAFAFVSFPSTVLGAPALTDNNFTVDTYSGPVIGSDRALRLGGAYSALATGTGGAAWNPASFASRTSWEVDWFEWELGLTGFAPGVFGKTDFLNSGHSTAVDSFNFAVFSARVQLGGLGLGLETRRQNYVQSIGYSLEELSFDDTTLRLGAAYAFWAHQVIVGFSAHRSELSIYYQDKRDDLPSSDLVGFGGTGLEAGLLLRPIGQPWRFGFSFRSPVLSSRLEDNLFEARAARQEDVPVHMSTLRGLFVPRQTYVPWQLTLGGVWSFGPRPFNRGWAAPADPASRLRRELRQRRCERAVTQVRLEAALVDRDPPDETCPGLQQRPRDLRWHEREQDLRRAEKRVLREEIKRARAAIVEQRRREAEAVPRRLWLLSVDLLFIGPSRNAIAIDALIEQVHRATVEEITASLRAGVETELVPGRLKLGAGYYLEPARSVGKDHRHHMTAGTELRLFRWDLFGWIKPFDVQAGVALDLSERYFDLGLGLGLWH